MATVMLGFNKFPNKYTQDGDNISPKIEIDSEDPSLSYALIMGDLDTNFIHWLVYIISNKVPIIIPEGAIYARDAIDIIRDRVPSYSRYLIPGTNSSGKIGYTGPYPSAGKTHHYIFKVYGLGSIIILRFGFTIDQLENAAQETFITDSGEAIASYG
jgi:Raf kinase inhibitor-like YbhB/YbcL family protein